MKGSVLRQGICWPEHRYCWVEQDHASGSVLGCPGQADSGNSVWGDESEGWSCEDTLGLSDQQDGWKQT